MANLNELTLDELAALGAQIATLITAGKALEAGRLGPVFDLTPGAPISIYTNAIMPAMDEGVSLTPLAADIVRRTTTRDLTHCDPELSQQLAKEREEFSTLMGLGSSRPEHVEIPSFLKRESTEAPPTSPAPEPVDPPSALGEVVGGGLVSAEASRSAEVAPSAEPEAERGGGTVMAASQAPAAPVRMNVKAAPWTALEDSTLIDHVVDAMTKRGMARQTATAEASRSLPGRTEDACIYRGKTTLRSRIDAALTEAAAKQAQTETPEIPPAEVAVASVSRDAAAGGHSPAAVQEVTTETLAQTFDRAVPDAPDLHGKDLELWRHLKDHRPRWPMTVGTDLDLVMGLSRGEKLPMIAADIGIDAAKLKERFAVLSRPIQDGQGRPTIDGMPRLVNLLRMIVKAPAKAA